MRTYGQYCPVAKAAEIFAEPWTPLIIRELLAGVCHFNEFERGLPGISRSLLAQRLRQLERVGVVERSTRAESRGSIYQLTDAGRELQRVVDVLGEWGARWAFGDPEPSELDPSWLLWVMRRFMNTNRLPPERVVVQFDFRGGRASRYAKGSDRFWLVLEAPEATVCLTDPEFGVDLLVTADTAAFLRVFAGRLRLSEAIQDGLVHLSGEPRLVRGFPRWWAWSPFAGVGPAMESFRRASSAAAG